VSLTYLSAIIALVLWSGTAIANKFAVLSMDGLTAGVLRSMLAGLVALGVVLLLKLPFPRSITDRNLLFVSGFCSFAIWPVLMSIGIENTTVGHAALIMALIPVITVLISSLTSKSLPSFSWLIGAAIALAATAVIILTRENSSGLTNDGSSMRGDLMVLAGCVVCSAGYVAGGKLSPKIGTLATTFWGLSVALLLLLPTFLLIAGDTQWDEVEIESWLGIAWMAVLSSLLGYALWFYALGSGGITRISSMQLMMPVLTLFLAVMLLGESLTVLLAFTCILIIGGTLLAQRSVSPDIH